MDKKRKGAHHSTVQPKPLQELRKALKKGVSVNPKQIVVKSVFINDRRGEYEPNGFAEGLLKDTFPWWLPDRVRCQMKDALRGLDENMALEVADDLVDCWSFGVRHYIGIWHIDNMLHSLYNKILFAASQQEVELPMHF